MAKSKYININSTALEKAHFLRIERYARLVDEIYRSAIDELTGLVKNAKHNPNKPFSFKDFPGTYQKSLDIFKQMSGNVTAAIIRGEESEWLHAASNNDDLIEQIFGSSRVGRKRLEQYQNRNLEALKSFQSRKTQGMGLSDRVWRQTDQFRQEMELGIDVGLGDGRSASALSRDLRSYLQNPDKLFRRVRDARGQLHLSKAAQAYSPGQGVYRSSYKNAMRLARTEINMAYRESDHHRWMELDFVVGIEIRLSNNPNHCPMCAQLAGRYPKDFKFTGWHPNCRCSSVPIMKTQEEMDDDIMRILNDEPMLPPDQSGNAVRSMPAGYTNWMANNNERILTAKSIPYFIRDNYKGGDVGKGLRFSVQNTSQKEVFVPDRISIYEKELGVKVDKSIFGHFLGPVPVRNRNEGAYYHPTEKYVNLPIDDYRRKSKWKAESVVYHEYGHAIDWEQGLRNRTEVKTLMDKYRKNWSENDFETFRTLDGKLWDLGNASFTSGEFDKMNQTAALHDTMMALNKKFGTGHSQDYFSQKGFSEAEFIAHAFENKFAGNPIFKQLAPDLYQEMIDLIDVLLGIKRSGRR